MFIRHQVNISLMSETRGIQFIASVSRWERYLSLQGLTKAKAKRQKKRAWLTFELDWGRKCDLKVVVVLGEGGEGGGVILSIVFLCSINVSVHGENNRKESPLASLAGYKLAVTQPLYMCLFITAFSQHAFKRVESGHHIFHRLITVHRYDLLLTKHWLQVRHACVLFQCFSWANAFEFRRCQGTTG